MAFNGLGDFSLSDGSSMGVVVFFNGGATDLGAQWIMADPRGPGVLQVTNFTKERRFVPPNQLRTFYWAVVTNTGLGVALFSLQGGGNV